MTRRWFISVVVAVASLAALTGAAAASGGVRDRVPDGGLLDRVAGILGIDRSQLDDAFAQARSELKDEKVDAKLAELVANGVITESEATAISDWLAARPAALDGIGGDRSKTFTFHRGGRRGDGSEFNFSIRPGNPGIPGIPPANLADRLDDLVTGGALTADQAAEVRAWLDARPAAVDKLIPPLPDPILPDGTAPFNGPGFFRFRGDGQFDFGNLDKTFEHLRDRLRERGFDFPAPDGGSQFDFGGFGPGFFRNFGGDGFHGLPPGGAPPAPDGDAEPTTAA